MDTELSSPNFNAARARSNSSSRVPDFLVSATSSHYRNVDSIFTQLLPLPLISTNNKVPYPLATAPAVPSPTTICDFSRRDDAIETALSQMSIILVSLSAAFASLGYALRRPDTPQSTIRFPTDFTARYTVF